MFSSPWESWKILRIYCADFICPALPTSDLFIMFNFAHEANPPPPPPFFHPFSPIFSLCQLFCLPAFSLSLCQFCLPAFHRCLCICLPAFYHCLCICLLSFNLLSILLLLISQLDPITESLLRMRQSSWPLGTPSLRAGPFMFLSGNTCNEYFSPQFCIREQRAFWLTLSSVARHPLEYHMHAPPIIMLLLLFFFHFALSSFIKHIALALLQISSTINYSCANQGISVR